MRGTIAKKLRKGIYQDMSIKKKEYKAFNTVKQILTGKNEEGENTYQNVNKATIICTGLRMMYKQAKKEYYNIKGYI
jgi:hypothetical protein